VLGANFLVVAAFYGIRAESRSNLITRNLCRRKPHATVAIVSDASQCRLVDREFAAKLSIAPNLVRRKTRRFQKKGKKKRQNREDCLELPQIINQDVNFAQSGSSERCFEVDQVHSRIQRLHLQPPVFCCCFFVFYPCLNSHYFRRIYDTNT